MTRKFKHIAVIPARAGSVGFPKKNQLFFDKTANFIKNLSWIDEVVVTSNDKVVLNKAKKRNFKLYKRSYSLSKSDISIKSVFKDLIDTLNIPDDVILWLFYLPILYKNLSDFKKAKTIIEKSKVNSLCSFISSKTHPFNCWHYDQKNKKLSQYVVNDIYRRQDLPLAWMHYHYLCCFKARNLKNLNNELLNSETHPVFLQEKCAKKLIEIDTYEDLKKWKKLTNKS